MGSGSERVASPSSLDARTHKERPCQSWSPLGRKGTPTLRTSRSKPRQEKKRSFTLNPGVSSRRISRGTRENGNGSKTQSLVVRLVCGLLVRKKKRRSCCSQKSAAAGRGTPSNHRACWRYWQRVNSPLQSPDVCGRRGCEKTRRERALVWVFKMGTVPVARQIWDTLPFVGPAIRFRFVAQKRATSPVERSCAVPPVLKHGLRSLLRQRAFGLYFRVRPTTRNESANVHRGPRARSKKQL